MNKKNKIVLFLFLATCFLLLLIILTSKILTIRSGATDQYQQTETVEKTEMKKVRSDYVRGVEQITQMLEEYIEDFGVLVNAPDSGVAAINEERQKILNLQDSLTDLLVPPEYRKIHLSQVLLFSRIESIENDNLKLMEHFQIILTSLKTQVY